jgi:hypothetical protein
MDNSKGKASGMSNGMPVGIPVSMHACWLRTTLAFELFFLAWGAPCTSVQLELRSCSHGGTYVCETYLPSRPHPISEWEGGSGSNTSCSNAHIHTTGCGNCCQRFLSTPPDLHGSPQNVLPPAHLPNEATTALSHQTSLEHALGSHGIRHAACSSPLPMDRVTATC